jgi:hypothetical protein
VELLEKEMLICRDAQTFQASPTPPHLAKAGSVLGIIMTRVAREIGTSREGWLGTWHHYDQSGREIGTSREGWFGTQHHYDQSGREIGTSREGWFGTQHHYDQSGREIGTSREGWFGTQRHSSSASPQTCFPGDAKILTPNGLVRLNDLKVQDLVVSWQKNTHSWVNSPIKKDRFVWAGANYTGRPIGRKHRACDGSSYNPYF